MLSLVMSLMGPGMMGAGKGGKGGKGKKFSVAEMLRGNYTIQVTKNGVAEELAWKGTFTPKNGTNEAPIQKIKVTTNEDNTTSTEILASKMVKLESASATHFKITVDGVEFLDANVTLNEQESVYKFQNATVKYTIFNGLYSVLTIMNQETKDMTEISFTKERVVAKSPLWMKLLQPLMLVANFWFSKKMKAKQMAAQGAQMPAPVEQTEDADQKKEVADNEGEEKQEGEEKKKAEEKKND